MLTLIRINKFYKMFYPNLNVRFTMKDLRNNMFIAEACYDVAEVLQYECDDAQWLKRLYKTLRNKEVI